MNDTTPQGDATPFTHPVRVADLSTSTPTTFELVPTPAQCEAIAADLGLIGLRKLRFSGALKPFGKRDWQMNANLGATVIQPCVVTLDPVTTRIEEASEMRWLKTLPEADPDDEIEMTSDENAEQLGEVIDLGQVMVEALALALPLYPRVEGAALEDRVFAEPGTKPMTDDDAKPFAGLASLRTKLANDGDSET